MDETPQLAVLYAGLETLGTATLVLNQENLIVYTTAAAGRLLNLPMEQLSGQLWATFCSTPLTEIPQRLLLPSNEQTIPVLIWQRPLVGTAFSLVCLEDLTAEEARENETLQMFGRMQTQADDLFALYQISQFLGTVQELDRLCRGCLRELERLTEASAGCLYLKLASGELQPQFWQGLEESPTSQPDAATAQAWFRHATDLPEILVLPLFAEDYPVGVVLLGCTTPPPRELRFLNTVAKEMGAAIQATATRQALFAKEQNLEAIINGTTDAIIQVGLDRLVSGFNPAAEQLTGYPASLVTGWSCAQLFGCAEGSGCGEACLFGKTLESAKPIPYTELRIAGRNGERHVAASFAPLEVNSATPPRAVAILRDITQQKQIEQMQTDFTAMISHELRTPLALLRGYTETLQHLTLSPQEQDYCLNGIATTTSQLQKLVEQVLVVSRIEAGRISLECEPLDVHDIIRQTLKSLPASASARIQLELAPDLPPLLADATRLEQVLLNLLENALKYSAADSQIIFSATPAGRQVQLQVMDEGIGVPPEEVETLFNKFERASNARQLQLPGTGLGLFICRNIVEAHGGRIKMVSNLGKGSCVTFWLPAAENMD